MKSMWQGMMADPWKMWGAQDLRSALSLQPVEGSGTWSYDHKKMNSANNLNGLGSELFHNQAPGENAAQPTP